MNALSRIYEESALLRTTVRAPRLADERYESARSDARRVEEQTRAHVSGAGFGDDEVELLGRSHGRGRPVVSVPSSAFFAQHLGQHPEARNARQEQAAAEIAYRDAADLGVVMDRPAPLSLAI